MLKQELTHLEALSEVLHHTCKLAVDSIKIGKSKWPHMSGPTCQAPQPYLPPGSPSSDLFATQAKSSLLSW